MLNQIKQQIKTPKVFEPLFKPARFKGAYGGRGSGKSHQFCLMLVMEMIKGARCMAVREIQRSIRDSSKKLIEDTIDKYGWSSLFKVTETEITGPNNSLCIFRGLSGVTATSIKSLENFNICFVDEAQTITQKSLDLLIPTIRAENSELWFSWNPTSRLDPIDKFMRKNTPKDSIIVEANWRDNKYFPKPLREDMVRDRQLDPEKASHIWDGDYASVTGGSYYSQLLLDCKRQGRITEVNYDPVLPVHVAWDLGIGDSTSLVLWQQTPTSLRIIDHYENHSLPLPHYIDWLQSKEYEGNYETDWLPHDAKAKELGTGLTRVETILQYESKTNPDAERRKPKVVTNHRIADGINAVRELLPQMWFDEEKCEYLLECLAQYREDYSEKLLTLTSRPLHDWTSHAADATRYMAMAYKEMKPETKVTEPMNFAMSLNKPPTLDELWDQHDSVESIGDW